MQPTKCGKVALFSGLFSVLLLLIHGGAVAFLHISGTQWHGIVYVLQVLVAMFLIFTEIAAVIVQGIGVIFGLAGLIRRRPDWSAFAGVVLNGGCFFATLNLLFIQVNMDHPI